MNNLYLDHDAQMSLLESEWRRADEASIAARSDYQSLAAQPGAKADLLDRAREHLDRAEASKSRFMVWIERLENEILRKV